MMRLVQDASPQEINTFDDNGYNAFHYAAKFNRHIISRELVNRGAGVLI